MNLVLIPDIAGFFHLFLVMLCLKHEVSISKKANRNFKKTWELLFFLEVQWQMQVISSIAAIL